MLSFAMKERVAAIVHGHKHMPYVCRLHSPESKHDLLVVSCGSAHHEAEGPCKDQVQSASCYRIEVESDRVTRVAPILSETD